MKSGNPHDDIKTHILACKLGCPRTMSYPTHNEHWHDDNLRLNAQVLHFSCSSFVKRFET